MTGDTGAFTPGFKLFHGRGAEGIGRRQHDLMAVLFQTIRQLCDRGGFAGAVDADGHDHERLACGIDGERLLAGLNDGAQVLSKHVVNRARVGKFRQPLPALLYLRHPCRRPA